VDRARRFAPSTAREIHLVDEVHDVHGTSPPDPSAERVSRWRRPVVDLGDGTPDPVDVDVAGFARRFDLDDDVAVLRRTLVHVAQAEHRAGGRGTEHPSLAATGFDHRESSLSDPLLGRAVRSRQTDPVGAGVGGFGRVGALVVVHPVRLRAHDSPNSYLYAVRPPRTRTTVEPE
jgi:hypothetical protein